MGLLVYYAVCGYSSMQELTLKKKTLIRRYLFTLADVRVTRILLHDMILSIEGLRVGAVL